MLLSHKDITPDIGENNSAPRPLSECPRNDHTGIAELLATPNLKYTIHLERPENRFGQTPASWAAVNGREGVVKALLARTDIGYDREDKNGRTPLWLAVMDGLVGAVKMLLDSEAINLNTAESTLGRTPLIWAARNGRTGVVRSLVEREDVDVNRKDKNGQTPLLWAAFGGHVGVVQVLLARKDINTDAADTRYGLTPLSWAALGRCKGVARFLLERDEGDPQCSYPCSTTITHTPKGARRLFSGDKGNSVSILNALNGQECTSTLLNAMLGTMRNTFQASLNRRLKEICSDPRLLSWNVEDGYREVMKMLLDHQDKGDGSNQALTHLPVEDEQALATRLKYLQLTELLLNWKLVAVGSIFFLSYWFLVFVV